MISFSVVPRYCARSTVDRYLSFQFRPVVPRYFTAVNVSLRRKLFLTGRNQSRYRCTSFLTFCRGRTTDRLKTALLEKKSCTGGAVLIIKNPSWNINVYCSDQSCMNYNVPFYTEHFLFDRFLQHADESTCIDHALSRRRRKSSSRHQIINHRWRLIAIIRKCEQVRVCKYNSVTARWLRCRGMILIPRDLQGDCEAPI